MSEKQTYIIISEQVRTNALRAVRQADLGYCVEIKPKTRSLAQNSLLWALLTEISEQVEWYGQRLTPDDWKHVFSAALKRQKVVPGLDGGFVVLGQHTSKMSKREFSELCELIFAFGAERSVVWHDKCEEVA